MEASKIENWYYDLLKKLAEDESEANLDTLKNMFKKDIDSTRRLDSIKCVAELIDALERRDVISEHKVDALHLVAECCGNNRLHRALLSYPMPNVVAAEINQYQQQRLAEELTSRPLNVNSAGQKKVPHRNQLKAFQMTDQKRTAVHKLLSQQIGKYWRRLGRELDVEEGHLDEIEAQFPNDLASRIFRVLHIFEQNEAYDPTNHAMLICKALGKCQRKDLIRSINAIISTPNREVEE